MTYLFATRLARHGALVENASYSRTTVTAPGHVFCSGIGTVSSAVQSAFRHVLHIWEVLDSGGSAVSWGNWKNGRQRSKSVQYGPLAVFVFETAGSYKIKHTVFDGYVTEQSTTDITVVAISAANTICISTGSDFTGAPGSVTDTVSDFGSAIATHLAAGKRVLFKKGDTFACASTCAISTDGIWRIGAWGSGALPKVQSALTSGNVIQIGGAEGTVLSDIGIADIEINGLGSATPTDIHAIKPLTYGGIFDHALFLRLNINNIGDGIAFIGSDVSTVGHTLNTRVWDDIAVVGCTIDTITGGGGTHGVYFNATRFGLIGNLVNDTSQSEHLVRLDYLYEALIGNNTLTLGPDGSGAYDPKENIAIRCVEGGSASVFPASSPTKYVVVSDNDIELNTAQGEVWGPANDSIAGVLQEALSEGNIYRHKTGITAVGNYPIDSQVDGHTIRNNLMKLAGFKFYLLVGVRSASTGMAAGKNIEVVNNSAYAPDDSFNGAAYGVYTPDVDSTGIVYKNNLIYVPGCTSTVADTVGSGEFTAANNSTSKTVDPWNTDYTNFVPVHVNVVGTGDADVAVFTDGNRARRGYGSAAPVMDMGAVLA